jgi:glycosyltransferase involved in cell wall biosynthesis
MHILYFIDSLVSAGAEQSLAAVAPYLVEAGVKLDVAYLHERPGLHDQLRSAGASVVHVGGSGRIEWARRATRMVRERRPDLVHTTLFEADIAGRIGARIAGVPVVSSLANEAYSERQFADPSFSNIRLRGARACDRLTGRWVARWHAVSHAVAEPMAARLRIPRSRIEVIHRGRDERLLGERTIERAKAARASLVIESETPLVVAAARHEYQKGLDLLIRSWPAVLQKVPEARLFVVGREGNQTIDLQALIESNGVGDSATLLGARNDVAELLCAANVLVSPSRWEGFGGTVLEGMALEAPIVATDIPPVREIADGEDICVFVPVEDPAALARGIAETLECRDLAARRARRARDRFLSEFTIGAVAQRTLDFYRGVLEMQNRPAVASGEEVLHRG